MNQKINKKEDSTESTGVNTFKRMVMFSSLIVCTIFISAFIIYLNKFGFPWEDGVIGNVGEFGNFGDFWGGLMNPLLQFIVITMLLWSIHIQQYELSETRKQLTLSADALGKQAELQRIQLDLMALKESIDDRLKVLERIKSSDKQILAVADTNGSPKKLSLNTIFSLFVAKGLDSKNTSIYSASSGAINQRPEYFVLKQVDHNISKLVQQLNYYSKAKGSVYLIESWLDKLFPYLEILSNVEIEEINLESLLEYKEVLKQLNKKYIENKMDLSIYDIEVKNS